MILIIILMEERNENLMYLTYLSTEERKKAGRERERIYLFGSISGGQFRKAHSLSLHMLFFPMGYKQKD